MNYSPNTKPHSLRCAEAWSVEAQQRLINLEFNPRGEQFVLTHMAYVMTALWTLIWLLSRG